MEDAEISHFRYEAESDLISCSQRSEDLFPLLLKFPITKRELPLEEDNANVVQNLVNK